MRTSSGWSPNEGSSCAHSRLKIGCRHWNLGAIANVATIGSLSREGLLQQRSALAATEQSRQERLLFCLCSSSLVAAIVEQPVIHTLPYLLRRQSAMPKISRAQSASAALTISRWPRGSTS
jgi:hypothetical protein